MGWPAGQQLQIGGGKLWRSNSYQTIMLHAQTPPNFNRTLCSTREVTVSLGT